MPLASAANVTNSLVRDLTPSESQHVDALLERAEVLIQEQIPDFSTRTGDGTDRDENFVKKVIHIAADAVARVFRNPGAYRQETEGNYSYTLDREAASGLLTIETEEWERLGIHIADFGTVQPATDGYARNRYRSWYETRPDLVFQWGWPGDKPGMSEVII